MPCEGDPQHPGDGILELRRRGDGIALLTKPARALPRGKDCPVDEPQSPPASGAPGDRGQSDYRSRSLGPALFAMEEIQPLFVIVGRTGAHTEIAARVSFR